MILQKFLEDKIKDLLLFVQKSSEQIVFKSSTKRERILFGDSLRAYLSRSYSKYSKQTNVLFRERPRDLAKYYVDPTLKDYGPAQELLDTIIRNPTEEKTVIIRGKKTKVTQGRRVIIEGTAGLGKSTVLKFWFLSLISESSQIPIMLELRRISSRRDTMFDIILSEFLGDSLHINRNILELCLNAGKVIILMDGFDEIRTEDREHWSQETLRFSTTFPSTVILLTTRPGIGYYPFERYKRFKLDYIKESELRELIYLYCESDELASRLLKELEHTNSVVTSSLLTPLLVILLIVSYRSFPNIPSKVNLYYFNVFEALYEQHDSTAKLGFHRDKLSLLAKDDFLKAVNFLSFVSYTDEAYSFSDYELNKYIAETVTYFNDIFLFENSKFKSDLFSTVCLLIKDGEEYTLIHRSFQEYFSALFLRDAPDEILIEASKAIILNPVLLLFSREIFEEKLIRVVYLNILEEFRIWNSKVDPNMAPREKAFYQIAFFLGDIQKGSRYEYNPGYRFRIFHIFCQILFDTYSQEILEWTYCFSEGEYRIPYYFSRLLDEEESLDVESTRCISIIFDFHEQTNISSSFWRSEVRCDFFDKILRIWDNKPELAVPNICKALEERFQSGIQCRRSIAIDRPKGVGGRNKGEK